MKRRVKNRPILGWREWVGLPTLDIPRIKAKVDTGARSSALHAFDIDRFERAGEPWVRFGVHPMQRDSKTTVMCEAPCIGERWIRSSNGARSLRPVVESVVEIGDSRRRIELTLASRALMGFRLLLGRQAVREDYLVHPGRSYLTTIRARPGRE